MARLKHKSEGSEIIEARQKQELNLTGVTNKEAPSDNSGELLIISSQNSQSRGKALDVLHDITTDTNFMQASVGPLNKLGTARILFNRQKSPMPQVEEVNDMPNKVMSKRTGDISEGPTSKLNKYISEFDPGTIKLKARGRNTIPVRAIKELPGRTKKEVTDNLIHLINVSTSPYTKIVIQGMPSEIEYNPESTWSTVRSIGRNNPFYIFTGSEDTISFDISWYANDPSNREDVINKCKLLESWTKADGYTKAPPILEIVWGKSGIFNKERFILYSAKYKLSNFQNSFKQKGSNTVVDAKLLPNTAVQNLVFKKVTEGNLTHEMIFPNMESLKTTQGIQYGGDYTL